MKQASNPQKLKQCPYLPEKILYGLWKYANAHRLTTKNPIGFEDLAAPDFSTLGVCLALLSLHMKNMGIEIDGLSFNSKGYYTYTNDDEWSQHIEDGVSEGIANSIEALKKNEFTYQDFIAIGMISEKYKLAEWFEFPTILSKKTQDRLDSFLTSYIEAFISDNLAVEKDNYYKFDRQKERMLRELKMESRDLGNTFVVQNPGQNTPNPFPSYILAERQGLFIHTLIALEKQGYFDVNAIWVTDWDVPPEKETMTYKVRVTLKNKTLQEENQPTKVLTKCPTAFNPKTSELVFQVHRAIISKTLDSNPHYLLKAVFKAPTKVWDVDELWEKLFGKSIEYNPRKHWKKLNNATYDLNEEIAKQTRIRDFVIMKKTTLQLNKKYLE